MNEFEKNWKSGLVNELHTLAGNLQHCNNAKQLRMQLQRLQASEEKLIGLIEEVEGGHSPIEDVWGLS